ncbi:hypothetical protein O3P69_016172 [Scylla paramamosain]|uniref:Uncharacterized protein n=1 Tax=Scylla paramamosain TaxID=85552 RepID=A0AAW0SF30_SCYPA
MKSNASHQQQPCDFRFMGPKLFRSNQGLNEGDETPPPNPSEGEQTEWRAGVVGQWLLTLTSVNTVESL